MRGFIFALVLIALPANAGSSFISGKEMKARVAAGDVIVKSNPEYDFPVEITLRADGTMDGRSENGYFDIGRWWLRGDVLCHQWDSWFDGIRKCLGVTANGAELTLAKPSALYFRNAKTRLK